MNLTSPNQVRALLQQLDVRPRKVLGQCFLIDANILEIMLQVARLSPDDVVLEVGPGLGVLTERLLEHTSRVVAIEKDPRLAEYLGERFRSAGHLQLVCADVMDCDIASLLPIGKAKIVANLPYAVGTRFLMNVVEFPSPPARMAVTLQLDVAERLAATPCSKAYGAISVLAQSRYAIRVEKRVNAACFFPPPDVRSAILSFTLVDNPRTRPRHRTHFRALVKQAFHHRRKQMGTILRSTSPDVWPADHDGKAMLLQAGLDPKARPDTLSVEEWVRLSDELVAAG